MGCIGRELLVHNCNKSELILYNSSHFVVVGNAASLSQEKTDWVTSTIEVGKKVLLQQVTGKCGPWRVRTEHFRAI